MIPINMAKRLSVKHRSKKRDQKAAYEAGLAPAPHKVALERSKKAKFKKTCRMH